MFKLALDAGHGLYTAGKRCLKSLDPNETREWVLNSRICNKIQQKLTEYEGIEVLRVDDTTGKTDISLANRCRTANNWGADYYLSIHHNAYKPNTGSGFEVYRYIGLSENGNTAKKQKIIADELIKAGVSKGNRSSNVLTKDLAVLRDTAMEAALVECAYMDSAIDVPVLLTDEFAEKVATACVNAIIGFGNLTKKASESVPEEQPPVVEESEADPEDKLEVENAKEQKNQETVTENVGAEDDTVKTATTFKTWIKAAGIRTLKTMAETVIALIGTNTVGITDVNWLGVLSVTALSGVVTILTCIKGLPEIKS